MTSDEFLDAAFALKPYLLKGLIYRHVRPLDAESIVLETFASVNARAHLLPPMDSQKFRNYLISACRNKMIDTFERRMYRDVASSQILHDNLTYTKPSPLVCDVSEERYAQIRDIARATSKHAPLVVDMLEAGFNQPDIAKRLGVTESRVCQLIAAIRARVQERLHLILDLTA